jgi:ATP-dependent helicase IRC3
VTLDFTPRFSILTPDKQPMDPRRPHDYQREAWEKLGAELAQSRSTGIFQGLVVMPTGSGKTFTAVHWLMSHVVSAGGRVLWLAHRHELLTQAGAEFHKLAALAHPRERLRVRIVSGAHCATTQVDPADDIVIASVASLTRRRDIARLLLNDEGRMVVIDEAHHAPAKSYRDIIEELQTRKSWRVLGLTATPTRTIEQQRPILAQLFGGRILYQVGLHELIRRGILSRPIPVIVHTGANVEAGVTDDDRAHYERFGELSEEWLDRIAGYVERNQIIVQHYLTERRKYGPTLIFAINVRHAALLAEDLRECGMRADYVASYRPDGSDGEPMTVIRQFREGHLEVLVNV